MTPEEIIDAVKASGLRGRGGAGFPTGMKWQFVDKKTPKPRYICCNADESEPGTFKDHLLMERNPHLLIEGCAICLLRHRLEGRLHLHPRRVPARPAHPRGAIAEAYKAGYLGKNILGTGFDCDVYMHRGAGAYEAGEETALIESLEGKRAQPRIKPPFPAAEGLYGCPTAVNNVETLCNVPPIISRGVEWFTSLGPEKNGGPKLFCVSGHVATARRLRSDDGRDRAAADLRLRRRHRERTKAEGRDSRRIVGARSCCRTRSTSSPASTACRRPGRCSDRPA